MKTSVAALLVAGVSLMLGAGACAQDAPSPVEAAMVKTVDAATPGAVELLERIVDINSGTMNIAGVVRVKDVVAPQLFSLSFSAAACFFLRVKKDLTLNQRDLK